MRTAQDTAFLVGNFDLRAQTFSAGFPAVGTWYHYFTGQEVTIADANLSITLEPGAFHLYTKKKLPPPAAGLLPFGLMPAPITASEPTLDGTATVSPNPADSEVVVSIVSAYRGMVLVHSARRIGSYDADGTSPKVDYAAPPATPCTTTRPRHLSPAHPAGRRAANGESAETLMATVNKPALLNLVLAVD